LPVGEGRPETGLSSGEGQQAAGGEVLSVGGGSLSHWPVPQVDEEQAHSQMLVVPVPDPVPGASFQELPHWKAQQEILWVEVRKETGSGKERFKIRDLFADERRSQAILDFLSTTDMGRRVGPDRAEGDAQSEASEWELWEREEREEREEEKRLEAEDGEACLVHERSEVRSEGVIVRYRVSISLGQAKAEGRGSYNEPSAD
jgi:hypothetical protein